MSVGAETSEGLAARSFRARGRMCFVAFVALVAAGVLDYVTGVETASTVFYVPALLVLAWGDTWGICVIYSLAAAGVTLGVDLAHDPARAAFVHPYWAALTDWVLLALLARTVSLLARARRCVQGAERAVHNKTLELQNRQRRLDETLCEVGRLRDDLGRREHQARVGDAVFATAHAMERPLASAAVYVDELIRLVARAQALKSSEIVLDELRPPLEKLAARVQSMDRILSEIRDLHKFGPRA